MAGAPIVASTSDSHASTALVGSTSGDVSVGMTTSDAHIMQALDNRDDEIFCLRHMAQIARKRGNAYGLMDRVLRECRKKGLDLDAVLTPPSGDGGSGGDDEPGRSAHPIEILEVVNASAGYCQARTTSPSGESTFFQNAAFEMYVLSLDAVNKAYKRNDAELISLIVHQEDLATVHALMGAAWKQAAGRSGHLISVECPSPVRVWLRQQRTYVACTLRVFVLIQRDSGRVSGSIEFLPRDVELVPPELPPPSSTPPLLTQRGSESAEPDTADGELLGDLSFLNFSPSAIAELFEAHPRG